MGMHGAGKTTLFNRECDMHEATSSQLGSLTRKQTYGRCIKPFDHIYKIDTPGMSSTQIEQKDAYELKEALTRQPVHQIVVVAAMPSVARLAELITSLKPIDKIMSCQTFKCDEAGLYTDDISQRAKVLLALTHRDRTGIDKSMTNLEECVAKVRFEYPWIGTVVMTDPNVSVQWLQRTIAVAALCEPPR
eukprot:7390021-Prymnesium_polylepis.1